MNEALQPLAQWSDWLTLFLHYLSLSLLSVGGALTTAPEMHRYLVEQQHWLTESQFNASIAIAQMSPGPNMLYIALIGWNIGLNTGSMAAGFAGAILTVAGILLPSSTVTYHASRWAHRNRKLRVVRAFTQGMSPIVVGLLIATGWIVISGYSNASSDWSLWLLTAMAALIVWRTRMPLLLLLASGAALGWFGIV